MKLSEAADVREHDRAAERQRGEEDARAVDPEVREHDELGPAQERRQLGVGQEAVHDLDARAGMPQTGDVHHGPPGDDERRARDAVAHLGPRGNEDVGTLVRPQDPR